MGKTKCLSIGKRIKKKHNKYKRGVLVLHNMIKQNEWTKAVST